MPALSSSGFLCQEVEVSLDDVTHRRWQLELAEGVGRLVQVLG
jgi:hypothetical protein